MENGPGDPLPSSSRGCGKAAAIDLVTGRLLIPIRVSRMKLSSGAADEFARSA
ncbi:hypothetical protein JOC55_001287 [Paenibacillus sacheonensis]|nr:hypothetical protein [Paenibacillus sacheonensis]